MTWNPTTGCTKVSPGCANCYADLMAKRLVAMGNQKYRNGFSLTLHDYALPQPLKIKKPQRIFVNSMSDLFHEDVPFDFIARVFDTMRSAHWHTFQILTKRTRRLLELHRRLSWPENVWMGVSIESQPHADRAYHLCTTRARHKFLSLEPLLGPIRLASRHTFFIDWIIVGGETGPGARFCDASWIADIAGQCANRADPIPVFVKKLGDNSNVKTLPDNLMIREFPL